MTRGLAIAALLLGLACAAPSGVRPPANPQQPGAKLLGTEPEVARQYDCATQKRPLLVLEESALRPTPLPAGQEFGHRIVYALCPVRARQPLAGKLRTRISFGGAVVVDDAAPFTAHPGRWAVDTFIALPAQAKPGAYQLEVTFTPAGGAIGFATKMPFSVWKK
jgi:hypothetical protein